MKIQTLASIGVIAAVLTACGGGDTNIDARNESSTATDNSVGDGSNNTVNEGGGTDPVAPTNPCASYEDGNVTRQGSYSPPHCIYGTDFASLSKPYTQAEELVFNDLPNDGVHLFNDSLLIGQNYNTDAGLASNGLTKGGDGSSIRLNAGVTLAFKSSDDYMVINRGSQIFAIGEVNAPVTITSESDAVDGTVGPEDVQQWGGLIVNGFAITNKCSYSGTVMDGNLATSDCHVEAEGKAGAGQTHYGGSVTDDSSGELRYFVVKHPGAEVAPGNELNGITFNGVGSGTEINFLQVYATYDDGIEFFGGSANVTNFVGMYARDDTIDLDEGYSGTIDYALVIQSEGDGDHCIESDGIGSYSSLDATTRADFVARGLNTRATVKNLTCIVSPNEQGTHAAGHGWRIREGIFLNIENAIVTTAYMASSPEDNYCVRIDSTESLQALQDGEWAIKESVIACSDLSTGANLPNGTTQLAYLQTQNDVIQTDAAGEDPTPESNPNLQILDGFYSLPLGDMVINGGPVTVTPTEGRAFLGAVTAADDWTRGWTYGIHPENRGQPLWFE